MPLPRPSSTCLCSRAAARARPWSRARRSSTCGPFRTVSVRSTCSCGSAGSAGRASRSATRCSARRARSRACCTPARRPSSCSSTPRADARPAGARQIASGVGAVRRRADRLRQAALTPSARRSATSGTRTMISCATLASSAPSARVDPPGGESTTTAGVRRLLHVQHPLVGAPWAVPPHRVVEARDLEARRRP